MERGFTQIKRIFTDIKLTSSIDLIENQKCLHFIISVPNNYRDHPPDQRKSASYSLIFI